MIVEGLNHNLLSVRKLALKDHRVTFKNTGAVISGSNFQFFCRKEENLYILKLKLDEQKTINGLEVSYTQQSELWHRRLGHLNRNGLKILGLPINDSKCPICIEGKAARPGFRECRKQTKQIGELIHLDIAGPINPSTIEGHRYFQVIVDYSHFTVVYLLKNKSEAEENLRDYIREVKTQHGVKTNNIRVDNGGEFTSESFKNFCRSRGIIIQYTCTYTPQQNDKSERMNRTLMDKTSTKFVETNLPKYLWGEAIRYSAFELNRRPTKANLNEVPAKIWYGKTDLLKLKVFGSYAWRIQLPRQGKFDPRASQGIMVGYSGNGYRLWDSAEDRIVTSRDTIFDESEINFEKFENNKKIIREEEEDTYETEDSIQVREETMEKKESKEELSEETSRPKRIINKPAWLSEYELYTAYCLLSQGENPLNYEEAKSDKEWREAITNEIEALKKQDTRRNRNYRKEK